MTSSAEGADARVIAVVGSTGRQGSAVVRHLLRDGWQVRALTRNPSSRAALALKYQGAGIQRVDAEELDSLTQAFAGAYGVFNVQNPMKSGIEAEVRQGLNVAEAAAKTGVSHVVYGAAGVDDKVSGVGSWDSKLIITRRFRDRGVKLTVLRPMAFMELMTDKGYYPSLAVWHVMPKLAGWQRPIGWLCVDDLGAIAARAFADPEKWGNTVLGLASDVQSLEECREAWREITGKTPHGFPMPTWLFERFVGTDLTTMWRWLRSEEFDMSTKTTREILPNALTVRGWLRSNHSSSPRQPFPSGKG
jgi:uncharacterized protein YbjT (DUF2867 family)